MAITQSFKDAIAANDLMTLRIMMKNSLLIDPTFSEFKEMVSAAENISGLYVPHDGREFITDKSLWNDDYASKLMVRVVDNFSHERINHLKDVVRHLRPIAAYSKTAPSGKSNSTRPKLSYQEQKRQDAHDGRIVSNHHKKIAASTVAGGIIGGTVASIAGTSIIMGAAIGAVVVGGAIAVSIREES